MMTEESLTRSLTLLEWLAARVAGIRLPGDVRTRLSAVCFGVAQEHHAAIVTLLVLRQPLYSSAFALARPLFEAYTRGMWLSLCATDEQVDRYLEGKIPDMASLIQGIERLGSDGDISNLRKFYDRSWKPMSGMTHTGAEHVGKWSNGEVLEPAYTSGDVARIADYSARIGVLSTAGLALLARDADLCRGILTEASPMMPPRIDALDEASGGKAK